MIEYSTDRIYFVNGLYVVLGTIMTFLVIVSFYKLRKDMKAFNNEKWLKVRRALYVYFIYELGLYLTLPFEWICNMITFQAIITIFIKPS